MDNKTLEDVKIKSARVAEVIPDAYLRGDGTLFNADAGPMTGVDLLPVLYEAKKLAIEVRDILAAEKPRTRGDRDGDGGAAE